MKDFYKLLKEIKNNEMIFAMATVIHVEGSAYRHEGAKLLISEDGTQYGTISAGCLEDDLVYQAAEVIKTKQTKVVTYDLRAEDDLGWGQGTGCNGKIDVYIEPFSKDKEIWVKAENMLDNGIKIICAKKMKGNGNQEEPILYTQDGEVFGESNNLESVNTILPHLKKRMNEKFLGAEVITFPELNSDYLLEVYDPKDSLFIFGAGPDVEPFVEMASALDFSVTIIDPRSSRCNKDFFPKADQLVCEHPDTYLKRTKILKNSYVCIMTHNFQRDQKILQHFIKSPPKYLGVLGPTKRTKRLLNTEHVPEWIHSPIGLDIQAEGPDEIAVSILAEMIKVRRAVSVYSY